MRRILTAKNVSLALLLLLVWSFGQSQDQESRKLVRARLQERYPTTVVGTKLLGLMGDSDSIQQYGASVGLAADLHGSINRDQPATYAIREGQARLTRGRKDAPLPAGESLYIHTIFVGSDVVTLGVITERRFSTPAGRGRLWVVLNFFFPEEVVAQAAMPRIYSVLDQWLKSGRGGGPPAPSAPPATGIQRASKPPGQELVQLKPGVKREDVLEALGPPLREVEFGERSWLLYGGLTVTLEQGELVAVDSRHAAPGQVNVNSEPPGAEIYVDKDFVGSTPARLELAEGVYRVSVRLPGYSSWTREIRILAGSDVSLRARLEKQ